ncbi:hypothetical protein SAMN02745163_00006 [Clostridium cavendishii DSM 21758]|uniref:Uncharacterized protein n=1 Tax=Clostridium cavendishii DSM 21758 TaxID=1121302 RepID=A0A1M6A7G0_9CLOT|nr:DUF6709 family protein [Clostridium cavendishii]SHI32412.1 hypothetical protein SAMN02745163_00006 [Clostridium cavendishii DSM 21758]
MKGNLIKKNVRKSSFYKILMVILIILGCLVLLGEQFTKIYCKIKTPEKYTLENFNDIENLRNKPCSVSSEGAVDLGIVKKTRGLSFDESSRYVAIPLKNQVLIVVVAEKNINDKIYSGYFRTKKGDEITKINKNLLKQNDIELTGNLNDSILDCQSISIKEMLFSLFETVLVIGGIFLFFKYIRRLFDITRDPIYLKLEEFGFADSIIDEFDYDVFMKNSFKVGKAIYNDRWLVGIGAFDMKIVKLEEILWVYLGTIKHSINYIPTGKTYNMTVILDGGGKEGIKLSKKDVIILMEKLREKMPWILVGYTEENIKIAFSKNDNLREYVNNRKADLNI